MGAFAFTMTDPAKIRSFIAVDIPEDLKKELRGLVETLKKDGADVKWVEIGNLHLTLKFLGWTEEEQLSKVKNLLRTLCSEEKPFRVHASALGGFPSLGHPRVLWVGLAGNLDALNALAKNPNILKPDSVEYQAKTKDLSAGGLSFDSETFFSIGSVLGINIELGRGFQAVGCLAKVCRVEENKTSAGFSLVVSYVEITSSDRTLIDQCVDKKIQDEAKMELKSGTSGAD